MPTGSDANRRQERGEQDEIEGNSINTEVIGQSESREPFEFFDELKFSRRSIKGRKHYQRNAKDQCADTHGDPACCRIRKTRQGDDGQSAKKREKNLP